MVIEWERTALPALKAIAASTDRTLRDGIMHLGYGDRGAGVLGLEISDGELHDALLALADVGYLSVDDITYTSGGGATFIGVRVTGRGMQALGQWPSRQAVMTPVTLLAVLERLRDYAPDEGMREDLTKVAESVKRSAGTAVREAVATFGAEALKAKLGLR